MVSGDCTQGCALLEYAECTLPRGVPTPISMLTPLHQERNPVV